MIKRYTKNARGAYLAIIDRAILHGIICKDIMEENSQHDILGYAEALVFEGRFAAFVEAARTLARCTNVVSNEPRE